MIACVGESLVDIIESRHLLGGCPFNVARSCARLGASVSYYGKVSSDPYGLEILTQMVDDCVIFDPMLCNSPKPTLCSKASVDSQGKAVYEFDYRNTCANDMTEEELSESFATMTDIDLVFFGSISLAMEGVRDSIVPAIQSIATHPKLFLDPNIRPALVSDSTSYRERILDLAKDCHVVKVSDEDLTFLGLGEKQMLDLGMDNLIVTRGEKGSTWYTRTFRVDCPSYPVNAIVDTIGCGDVFDGAVLTYLQSHDLVGELGGLDEATVKDILVYAGKAAALNCLAEGCNPPFAESM